MVRYETLFLAIPEITSDETSLLESGFRKILNDHKALDLSFERWGKYRLAYPVRKNEYGVYFLARFEVDAAVQQEVIKDLDLLMKVKLNKIVMRFGTYRLDESKPLTYHRPESLEEIPSHDVDSVLKEGAGLLGQGRAPRGRYQQRSYGPGARRESFSERSTGPTAEQVTIKTEIETTGTVTDTPQTSEAPRKEVLEEDVTVTRKVVTEGQEEIKKTAEESRGDE
jgi:small subunit ribosomal protein S6